VVKRLVFDNGYGDAVFHFGDDGELTVTIETPEIGDSESGWTSGTGTLILKPAEVERLREFLTE
jgi:hypothetical protein